MDKKKQKELIIEIMQSDEKDMLYEIDGKKYKYLLVDDYWTLTIKTRGRFLWRLWFLMSAPVVWLIKGEVKIK